LKPTGMPNSRWVARLWLLRASDHHACSDPLITYAAISDRLDQTTHACTMAAWQEKERERGGGCTWSDSGWVSGPLQSHTNPLLASAAIMLLKGVCRCRDPWRHREVTRVSNYPR
jgi:hypothetical protein